MVSTAISVAIGGVDYTSYVEQTTFEIDQVLTRRGDTAVFWLVSSTALTNIFPLPRITPVVITDAHSNPKFGGLLTDVIAHLDDGPIMYKYECHCQDYSYLLTKTLGNKKYANQTVDQIAKDLIATYLPGVMTTNNVQSGLPSIQYFNVNHLSLSDAFDKLVRMASAVPLVWDVDPLLDLHFTDTMHIPVADMALVDTATSLQNYATVVQATSGLVGYWPMNDYTPTMKAVVGPAGSYSGGYTQMQAGPVTGILSAVTFDGSTGYATIPNGSGLLTGGAFSIECWANLSAATINGQSIWGYSNYVGGPISGERFTLWQLGGSTSLTADGHSLNGNLTTVYPVTPNVSTSAWHHLVFTYDGGSVVKFYVDAQLLATWTIVTTAGFPTSVQNFYLANQVNGAGGFGGITLSQFAMYNGTALSLATIQAHYAAATLTNQVGYDRPTFTYEADATQLSNDVTVRGGTYLSGSYTQHWVGNANQTSFPFDYPPDTTTAAGGSMPTVTVGGTGQTVALDTGSGFGTNQALVSVAQNSQSASLLFATAPGNGVVVAATYVYDLPVLIERKNQASVARFGRFQEYVADSNIKTQQAATQRASGEIAEFAWPVARVHAETDIQYVGALGAGQSVLVTCSQYGLAQVPMIVDTCRIRCVGGGLYTHQLDLVTIAPIGPPVVYQYGNAQSLYGYAQYN